MKPTVTVNTEHARAQIAAVQAQLAALERTPARPQAITINQEGDVTAAVRSRKVLELFGPRGVPILGRRWVLDVNRWQQRSVPKWGAGWVTVSGGDQQGRRVGVYVASPHTTVSLAHLDW